MGVVTTVEKREKTDNQPHIVFGIVFTRISDFIRNRDIAAFDRIEKLREKRETPFSKGRKDKNRIHATTNDGDNIGCRLRVYYQFRFDTGFNVGVKVTEKADFFIHKTGIGQGLSGSKECFFLLILTLRACINNIRIRQTILVTKNVYFVKEYDGTGNDSELQGQMLRKKFQGIAGLEKTDLVFNRD